MWGEQNRKSCLLILIIGKGERRRRKGEKKAKKLEGEAGLGRK